MVKLVDLKVAAPAACAAVNGDTVVIPTITVVLVVKAELALEKHHLLQDQELNVVEATGLPRITTAELLALTMATVLLVNRASRI